MTKSEPILTKSPTKDVPRRRRESQPGPAARPLHRTIIYNVLRVIARMAVTLVFQLRVTGRENYPPSGGALVCSNHQSHLDPVIVGLTVDRRLNYLARKSLFKFPPLRMLMEFLDAIPLDREGIGVAGIKETMHRLRRGEMVLMFPEGTRTFDRTLQPLMPGFVTIARRCRVPLVPVGLDGAFQAWPRGRAFPLPGVIDICVGPPITVDEINQMSDQQLQAELSRRIDECLQVARSRRQRAVRRF